MSYKQIVPLLPHLPPLYSKPSPAIYFIAIPFLGIYLEKTIIPKDTCTPMSIAGLFTMPRTWKQPKCPSAEKWIKMWYIYSMAYYLAIKRNEIVPYAETWMDLETVIQSEVSKKEKTSI